MIKDQKKLAPQEKSYTLSDEPVTPLFADKALYDSESFATMSDQRGTPNPSNQEILFTTASWGQGGYYNNVVSAHIEHDDTPPKYSTWKEDKVPVGCTPATIAILLRYHEWPIRFREWYPHTDDKPHVFGYGDIYDGYTYNWADMPLEPTEYNSDIAWLMFHAGLINKADWKEYSTGASVQIDVINTHLGYRDGSEYKSYYANGNHAHNKPESNCVPFGFGAHDYFFCPNEKTWFAAQIHCENVGMNLVRIDSGDATINGKLRIRSSGYVKVGPDAEFVVSQ